jgi:hypothetical protein
MEDSIAPPPATFGLPSAEPSSHLVSFGPPSSPPRHGLPRSPQRVRAEEKFKSAFASLRDAAKIGSLPFPDFERVNDVEKKAAELGKFLEQLSRSRNEAVNAPKRTGKFKSLMLGWLKASYPFATLFLEVAKEGANVNPLV